MILNHINHKMPIYKDCTLFELLAVSIALLFLGGGFLACMTWMLFGYASIGCALSILSLVHATRFILGRLQRLKYGKPYGYYQHLFFKKLSQIQCLKPVWQSPWMIREGRWSVRRTK